MPYTVGCTPAPLTFTIRPKMQWQSLLTLAWFAFIGYEFFVHHRWNRLAAPDQIFDTIMYSLVSLGALVALIRRERIEVYSEQMVWRKTYFGFTTSTSAPLNDVMGAEWNEGKDRRGGKAPNYVSFYLADGRTITGCIGLTFDDFDRFREDIRSMFPDVIKRWGRPGVTSKNLTLLNLS